MKIFIAGDYWSCTGPALVTKNLITGSNPQILYLKTRNKILRSIEIFYKTLFANAVVYSGFSRQNILGFHIASLFHRPSFYLMHGSIYYENLINEADASAMVDQESVMLQSADFILAVSKTFETWLKEQYPQYHHKIYTLTNGIDWDIINSPSNSSKKISGQILSVGGGMPQKNILAICKAIDKIYEADSNCSIKLIVLGDEGRDTNAIRSYPFVTYCGLVSHEECLKYMGSSQLFIQNSTFETFGLAPIEALLQDCSLLISSRAGACSVITALHEEDLITNPDDISGLQSKIQFALQNPNSTRLLEGIDKNSTSIQYRQKELFSIVKNLSRIEN